MKWATPSLMPKLANEHGQTPELRDVYLTIADDRERQGCHQSRQRLVGPFMVISGS
jgi:hypothetical protein